MHAFLINACAELDLQYGYVRFLDQCFDTTSDLETFLDSNYAPKHTRNFGKIMQTRSIQNHKNTIFFVWSFGEFAVGPVCTPVAVFFIQSTARIGDGGADGRDVARRADKCSSNDLLCGGRGVHQRTGPFCFFQMWHLRNRGA